MKGNIIFRRSVALLLGMLMLFSAFAALISCSPDDQPGPDEHPKGTVEYKISVKTRGGLLLKGTSVVLEDADGGEVASGKTDANGAYSAWLKPAIYTVKLKDLAPGYSASDTSTGEQGGETAVIVDTSVIKESLPSDKLYAVGDVMYDFTFMKDGAEVTLSQLLEEKKLVLLNFWASWCSPCKAEFPAFESVFREYGDDLEIVAMSTDDNATACNNFKSDNGYTFNMVPDVNGNFYAHFLSFHEGSIPCTVFIDRYGVITEYVRGGNPDSEVWKETVARYISDDYVQTSPSDGDDGKDDTVEIEKPDVEMPSSSEIEAIVNGAGFGGSYTASASEYVWPWVITDDRTAIRPSNYGKQSSSAMINTDISLTGGQVFAFDCRYAIEYDTYGTQLYDMLAVYVDGYIMQKVYGVKDGWTTVYAYTPDALSEGEHTVTLAYVKDSSDGYRTFEEEFVEVKNIRIVSLEDMISAGGSMNVFRCAATGVADDDASTSYKNYAKVVLNEKDGYYHVGTADGPILLAKLCGSTQWSPTSLEDMANAGMLLVGGLDMSDAINADLTRSYCWLEENSDLGYSVVDETLAELLDMFVSSLGEGKNHEWEWLELCCYFDHYGAGNGIVSIKDVRSGIDEESAFDAQLGKNHAVINRVIVPRGHYFKFVPDKTGVYAFYSLSKLGEGDDASTVADIDTIAWLYDADGNVLDEGTDERDAHFVIKRTCQAGETYYIAVGFDPVDDLGEFDFMIEYVGEKLDVLTTCTEHYTTTEDGGTIIIDRRYNFHAALGDDGYYHQVLGYENGEAILDYSETGYVYIDFLKTTVLTSFIGWPGDYCTLEKYTNGFEGYVTVEKYDDDGNVIGYEKVWYELGELGRFDNEDVYKAMFGDHQAEMEAYLEMAKSGDADSELYGYVKADETLVKILDNLALIYGEAGVEDQWLMTASFYRHV